MSSIVSAITGTGSQASLQAQQANLQTPTTSFQADTQYNTANNALNQQQNFVNAVNSANGVGNQSQVFNQLQGVANGTGPNPAQAQLNQTTGQNVAAQNALMAGQRGSSQNVGLIARQAAQQGASTQQQAIGQGATLAANQELNAINSSGTIAGNQANQQATAVSGLNSAAQGEQANVLNSIAAQNTATVGSQNSVNSANSALEQQNATGSMQLAGNLTGGLGSAIGLANGGMVPKYAFGGVTAPSTTPATPSGPQSSVANYFSASPSSIGLGKAINSGVKSLFSSSPASAPVDPNLSSGDAMWSTGGSDTPASLSSGDAMDATANFAKGGKVPALVSPGEVYLPPKKVKEVMKGKDPIKAGEKIPGKPKHKGNDYRNDVVPKKLDEGGIVIPNKILQGKNPHWEAMRFVHQTLRKGK